MKFKAHSKSKASRTASKRESRADHSLGGMIRRAVLPVLAVIALGTAALAGDILRGGATADPARRNAAARASSGAEAAAIRAKVAQDRLARTTQVINALRSAQLSAASAGQIPNGLVPGGLQVATGANARWVGAQNPTQSGSTVNVKQTAAQAILNWESFNIGRETTLNFDQSGGGRDIGKWIVFNHVLDPTGVPSRILGKINAGGQVYVLNQNGIIFDGTSQVNTRSLVASSLPINENLVTRGLLNQNAANAEFLFSNTSQNGFSPPPPYTPGGIIGDVVVRAGAILSASVSQEGSGGRIALIGPNVHQGGTISTPNGQAIIAAGLQVGWTAHSAGDPSLRGLDTFVGDVGTYGGTARNTGLINIPTGSLSMTGKAVEQLGAIDSLTTVTLNGRIDLLANYNSLPSRDFDPSVSGGTAPFLPRTTGHVHLGPDSVMRILPDYGSDATTVGTSLPLKSQINLQGRTVHFGRGAMVLAPNAAVGIRAGNWGPVNLSNGSDGTPRAVRSSQEFVYTAGQIYLDSQAVLDVSGSSNVFVPLSQSILEVQLRGNELSVSPLQRTAAIRGVNLVIDSRRSGTFFGRQWIGTPLGDAAGFADIIQRTAGQLTTQGGTITMQAGQAIIANQGAILDVSGGFSQHEAGRVQTTRLLYQGRYLINIADATPDRLYDGIFTAQATKTSEKWSVTRTWSIPLAPLGTYNDPGHVAGAAGGQLNITAPGLVLDGDLLGQTVVGPRQLRKNASLSELPEAASLTLRFEGQRPLTPNSTNFFLHSPTPPTIVFGPEGRAFGVPSFDMDALQPIPASRLARFSIPASFFERSGFGSLEIVNDDGEFVVPAGRAITLPAGTLLSSTARNVTINTSIEARGGQLIFVAYNLSPYQVPIDEALNPQLPQPTIDATKGSVVLGQGVKLDVSGLIVDDRHTANLVKSPQGFVTDAGAISLSGYNLTVPSRAILDASGGLGVNVFGDYQYGNAGSITLAAGNDLNYPSVLGGKFDLKGQLLGYAGRGARGGTLSIKAPLIQVGGNPLSSDTLLLRPNFFSTGGFQSFALIGIGARSAAGGLDPEAPTPMVPAVYIAPGVLIEPLVESLAYTPFPGRGREAALRRITRPLGDRPPVSISLQSSSIRNDFFDPTVLEPAGRLLVVRGDVVLSEGARIVTEPGGNLTMRGSTVTILGELTAPGGTITLTGANSFPQNSFNQDLATNALTTVYIGPRARISASGVAAYYPDSFGRRVGEVFNGGSVLVSGNIVAEAGAILEASGASGVFDFHPFRFARGMETRVPQNSGINAMPYALRTIPFVVESDGGLISLAGSQMLYSDATLIGKAGGETALGGTLSVSSGRFYEANSARSTADINMIVTQNGTALNGPGQRGIGRPVRDSGGVIRTGDGFFAANKFQEGGFDNLDLNYYYDESAQLVAQAGNIRFVGNVNINARGFLRVAGGGVLQGDGLVRLSAPYVAIGQEFRPPLNPGDTFIPYRRFDVATGQTVQDFVAPTFGGAELSISASLLDVGTVVLKNFGTATLAASGGDIRGSGTFNIAGSLTLDAAQIYPVTLSSFSIFAYDSAGGPGSIVVKRSGQAQAPLSAGGSLRLFASEIDQGGVLLAPFGSIVLGWDGTDDDLATAGLNQPINAVTGTALPVPVAQNVTLRGNSITSVAGIDFGSNTPLLIPYGLSPDGVSVFDPRGVNFTASGLIQKRIVVAGNRVVTEGGSVIDLRGGGELLSYRWIQGTGGPVDILGTASQEWTPAGNYQTGDLVLFDGRTYSARIGISPSAFAFNQGPRPGVNRFWTEVAESYAIVPGFHSKFAPYAPFNSDVRAASLGGDPGYVSNSLRLGDRIFLDGGSGLPEGNYTLLPRRYGLLPGAYIVTPQNTGPYGIYTVQEGSTFLTGYRFNSLNTARTQSPLRSRFEVAPPEVVAGRARYETYSISDFLKQAALDLDLDQVQRLPEDSGYLLLSGNTAMSLAGRVLSSPLGSGRGSMIDIASFADITITDTVSGAPGSVVLNAGLLSSFGADSLVIGAIRRAGATGTSLEVRTGNILIDNPDSPLVGTDITLAVRTSLEVAAGSIIQTSGGSGDGGAFTIQGDGAAIRVSGSENASLNRTGITSSPTPLLTIGAGSMISGAGVTLDSSYGFDLDPTAEVVAQALTFGAGQIGILLDGPVPLTGQIDVTRPQLVIAGTVLAQIGLANSLSLIAYQNTIDLYGPGSLGNSDLMFLSMQAGEIRGFNQGPGETSLNATEIEISNPRNIASSGVVSAPSGSLVLNSQITRIGVGENRINRYSDVVFNAAGGLVFSGVGALRAQENIVVNTPLITTEQGANQNLIAGGTLQLNKVVGPASVAGGFGGILNLQGSSVTALTDIIIPGGLIDIRAISAGGDVTVGGLLDTRGLELSYYDVTRYTDGGEIRITSQSGDVALLIGSDVSVSAAPGGGNAGFVTINAPLGQFSTAGILEGQAGTGGRDGSFRLDAGSLASFELLRDALNDGHFNETRDLRVRNGTVIVSGINTARNFSLSTDNGGITVSGTIDASGETGGSIFLSARNNLLVQTGALLTAAGQQFSNAGKGGTIFLEAGASANGIAGTGLLTIDTGSLLDLSVASYRQGATADPNGNYQDPTSSAFLGQFQGTLHLRTPQISGNTDVSLGKVFGTIQGASSVIVEGYRIYQPASGVMNIALRNQINADAGTFIAPNEAAMRAKIFGGTINAGLDNILVIAPGAEVVNLAGDLTLGVANPGGSTNVEARSTADWDLSAFRYGSRQAPGILTLRARGDLVFNNTLSDGFNPIAATSARGNTAMWLATPQEINPLLPVNTQSWSYRLTAGADTSAVNTSEVLPISNLLANKGSILVGEFYPAIPNTATSGGGAAAGLNGLTANTIRISTSATDLGTRYEIIRTGTGDISVNAGRDVQLRNQFATIYSAGVAIPLAQRTRIFQANDFVVPLVTQTGLAHPNQGTLGAIQQTYAPYYTMAGGDVRISAGNDIGRFTIYNGNVIADTSRQIPTNWLYRRGYVDETGNFGVGGVGSGGLGTVSDPSASTTWWVDFSNFFQGFGSFGGGDISLVAGRDVVNADAVVATNARMAGRNPISGLNIAPDVDNLLEYGGGDLVVRAGRNLDGGSYYLERGVGTLFAGGEITTNAAKTISRGILAGPVPEIRDQGTWLPTLLFLGKSSFDVSARSNILIGPATNAFGLPQGLNNKFWYKTQFTTFGPEATVDIRSFGGSVTHRLAVSLPGDSDAQPILLSAIQNQNAITPASASNFQPWIRLSERSVVGFRTMLTVNAPSIKSTAFSGDINLVGNLNLFPSSSGTLELVASGGINGLQRTGQITGTVDGNPTVVNAFSSATINVSDADPARLPGVSSPLAFQSLVGRELLAIRDSLVDPLRSVSASFQETGAFSGAAASISTKQALHAEGILHRASTEPVRIYATGGSISGLTLFTPKLSRIVAEQDITDIAFYLQNANEDSVSIVSAGRDIIPFNENSPNRVTASNLTLRNVITDTQQPTVAGTLTRALPGDLQINGPGALEVLAGRNIDLGTGANFVDGRGTGITSIGRERNPFLPIDGARLVVFAGIKGKDNEGPAIGLAGSNFNFEEFIDTYLPGGEPTVPITDSDLLEELEDFASLSPEQQNILALDVFFAILRQSATEAAEPGGTYALGNAASALLFGDSAGEEGSIQTRSRDIRTASGGGITIGTPSGGITLASDIFGNPLTPPGIVTAAGGSVSIFMRDDLDIGQARVFTLRGGDLTIWSTLGDIAAGTAAKTVVSAPPTRVVIDSTSGEVVTDLGGLATGGGIGVLASVAGVKPGGVFLIAPQGTIDAGDAGIRATGDITLAADAVLNADNISAGGTSTGVPAAPAVAAPNIGGLSSASSSTAATSNAATQVADQARPTPTPEEETPSEIEVEVLGYGGGEGSSQ